jgi:alkanesulfonate monooxygenase SsuD/methylene tetrahydromethanopterin reductase-like flavin-dependent oxidoreductase (luciferase family)
MENHGTNFKKRWRVLRERVLAMKEIWTKEEAEFHGEFVNFDKIWCHPKPVQKPHPPVLMGGDGPTTFERVIQFCDGWLPIGFRAAATDLVQKITDLRQQAEAAGRDPKTISITVFGAQPDSGTINELAKAGVERAVVMLPAAQRDTVLPLLDRYASLMK